MNAHAVTADPHFRALKERIIQKTGLGYYADKDEDLAARVSRRLAARGLRGCSPYFELLEGAAGGPQEWEALIAELTIGETYFFRQREQFQALRDIVLPDLLARNASRRRLRIWSAGCATGAETYSVALLLRLEMAAAVAGWNIGILGTDINPDFVARAREGIFDNWAFRDVPEDLRARCFQRHGKSWSLLPEYREGVTFQVHNLVAGTPPWVAGAAGDFDLILCRNVLIYFSPQAARLAVGRFHEALHPAGWLAVGHAEPNAALFQTFESVSAPGVTLYRKPDGEGRTGETWSAPPHIPAPALPGVPPYLDSMPAPPLAPAPPPPVNTGPAGVTLEEVRRLADRGQWDLAAARCRELIASHGLNAAAHFTLGLILEHNGRLPEVQEALRRAIYLDRSFALAHYHLGRCLHQQKSAQEARRAFRNALDALANRRPEETLEHGDGITAGELTEAAKLHLELLDKR